MQQFFSNPLALAVLALLVGQGLIALIGGFRQQRQQRLGHRSEAARQQIEQELFAWRVLLPQDDARSPAARDLSLSWPGIAAWSRLGMGAGMLFAAGAAIIVLALSSASGPLSPAVPADILAVTLLLQAYASGMCCGAVLGLLIGAPRIGPAPRQPAAPAPPAPRLADYRVRQVALLPGALLLIDVALVGGLSLRYLAQFTQAQFWTLIVFPGLLLLACALAEWFTRRLARLPLRLTSDPALAGRAENRVRARIVGLLLERELFALFILTLCQWFMLISTPIQSNSLIYSGAPLVYAVVLLSMRGLLERAQQDLGAQAEQGAKP